MVNNLSYVVITYHDRSRRVAFCILSTVLAGIVERGFTFCVCEPPTASSFGHPCTVGVLSGLTGVSGQRSHHDRAPARACASVCGVVVLVFVVWSCCVKLICIFPPSPPTHTHSAALHGREARSEDAVQSVLWLCTSGTGTRSQQFVMLIDAVWTRC